VQSFVPHIQDSQYGVLMPSRKPTSVGVTNVIPHRAFDGNRSLVCFHSTPTKWKSQSHLRDCFVSIPPGEKSLDKARNV
jgi:hypothetical protein